MASRAGSGYDLRRLLDGTLMRHLPHLAVTLVENHDTQPLQALESVVEPWFKPLAYAFILLRREGYPCLFLPDYEGARYRDRQVGTFGVMSGYSFYPGKNIGACGEGGALVTNEHTVDVRPGAEAGEDLWGGVDEGGEDAGDAFFFHLALLTATTRSFSRRRGFAAAQTKREETEREDILFSSRGGYSLSLSLRARALFR